MEQKFSAQVMSLLNSAINPLMSSMVSMDELIQEESQKPEKFSKLLSVDQQIQRSIEFFLELRTLVMLNYEHELCFPKEEDETSKKKNIVKEVVMGLLVVIVLGIMVTHINMMLSNSPIF